MSLDRQYLPIRAAELTDSDKIAERIQRKGDNTKRAARNAGMNGSTDGSDQLDRETHAAIVAYRQNVPTIWMRHILPVGKFCRFGNSWVELEVLE